MTFEGTILKSQAFRDLTQPVIFAGGDLGIYYVNGEKVCMDDTSFLHEHANDPQGMAQHCISLMDKHPEYDTIITAFANKAKERLKDHGGVKAIAGGQRRDWVFSGPTAHKLGWPHIAIYKDGRMQYFENGEEKPIPPNVKAVVTTDMITAGSSAYNPLDNPPTGWVPWLRDNGVNVEHLITLLSRVQGGEENLAKAGVRVEAFAKINKDFLQQHSSHPERATSYLADPVAWTKHYLANGDLGVLVPYFNPEDPKLKHVKNFLAKYGEYLKEIGRYDELNGLIKEQYGKRISDIIY